MNSKSVHRTYLIFLFSLALLAFIFIGWNGFSYYFTPIEERPFHTDYYNLKPSGIYGHGFGIVGSALILIGVIIYSSRKRISKLSDFGKIKYFLEFHIFLCLLGPILILYHTTFKFGGIVAISFWSMSSVVLSGIIGRYIYNQIPKNISGNELKDKNLLDVYNSISSKLINEYKFSTNDILKLDEISTPNKNIVEMNFFQTLKFIISNDFNKRKKLNILLKELKNKDVIHTLAKELKLLSLERLKLKRSILLLEQFHKIFHLWHVVHLPFSIIMFLILIVHIVVSITFGYVWIF